MTPRVHPPDLDLTRTLGNNQHLVGQVYRGTDVLRDNKADLTSRHSELFLTFVSLHFYDGARQVLLTA